MATFIGRYVRDIPATSSGSVTTHFIHRSTTKYSWACNCIKTVKTIYIDHNGHLVLWLTMMEGQQSLTLYWRLFSRWGRERFTFPFAYQCSQYSVYADLQPVAPQITQDTWPTMVDIPLMLIFLMAQREYFNLFCLSRRPKIPLWLSATYLWGDYPGRMTKNCWRSVDAHFQVGAGMVLQSVLSI